jgi:hypothetical protein
LLDSSFYNTKAAFVEIDEVIRNEIKTTECDKNIKAYNNDSSSNEFAALLQTDLDKRVTAESSLVNGIVSRIEEKIILIDVGLKSEGVINKSELTSDELETLKSWR